MVNKSLFTLRLYPSVSAHLNMLRWFSFITKSFKIIFYSQKRKENLVPNVKKVKLVIVIWSGHYFLVRALLYPPRGLGLNPPGLSQFIEYEGGTHIATTSNHSFLFEYAFWTNSM